MMENPMTMEEPLTELPPLDDEPLPQQRAPKAQPGKRGKPGRRAAPSSTSSSGASKEARLKTIRADLDATFVLLGTAASPFVPVTGATLIAKGPQGSDIVCNIARRDERVYRALLAVSQYAVYGELAMFIGALGIALTVDMGQTSPNSFIAQRMIGVEILSEVYGNRSNGAEPQQPVSAAPSGWNATG